MAELDVGLSYADRVEIMKKYHSGDKLLREEAMSDMLNALDSYIYYVIHHRFAGYRSMMEDLAQSAKCAIIEHMADYNPEFRLTTFFLNHIQNALQDEINNHNNETHYYAESKNMIVKTARSLGMDIDNIDTQIIAIHMNTSQSRIESILDNTLYKKKVELIEEVEETCGQYSVSPEKEYIDNERSEMFQKCLSRLEIKEQIVLCLATGFYMPVWNEGEWRFKLRELQVLFDNIAQKYPKIFTEDEDKSCDGVRIEEFLDKDYNVIGANKKNGTCTAESKYNVINIYRAAKKHIVDVLYEAKLINRKDMYKQNDNDSEFKLFDEESMSEFFEALNETKI